MSRTIADQIAETLAAVGVQRICGLPGDSLNGITDAQRGNGPSRRIRVRQEEGAAFAAGPGAHLIGSLAACAGSCDSGKLHV